MFLNVYFRVSMTFRSQKKKRNYRGLSRPLKTKKKKKRIPILLLHNIYREYEKKRNSPSGLAQCPVVVIHSVPEILSNDTFE